MLPPYYNVYERMLLQVSKVQENAKTDGGLYSSLGAGFVLV